MRHHTESRQRVACKRGREGGRWVLLRARAREGVKEAGGYYYMLVHVNQLGKSATLAVHAPQHLHQS